MVENGKNADGKKVLRTLIENDDTTIHEMSYDKDIMLNCISRLRSFLRKEWEDDKKTDLYVDLYELLLQLDHETHPKISLAKMHDWTSRWPSGLRPSVVEIREKNKERMLHLLVEKVERSTGVRYHFEEGLEYKQKYELVKEWWNEARFQTCMAIKGPKELNRFLGKTLSTETMYLLKRAQKKGIPFFVTPYYLSLLNTTGQGYDDTTIRSYILYSPPLVEHFGNIRAWEREDVVEQGKSNAAGWLVPYGDNIHRRYPEVAILIPDTMGRACGGLCASCQRMYGFQNKRLHFEFEQLNPKETWPKKLARLMRYFEEDSQLRDILITGGDALMNRNKTLKNILEAVYQMALRKHEANHLRPEGKKYAELQRVRLGTRLPAYLPMRITDDLVKVLKDFKEKASTVGIRQFIIQTHFQSPLEITPEAAEGVRKLLSAGWMVTNQLVFNVAASRRGHTQKLRQVLNSIGVLGYYTFTVKGFEENKALFAPNARSVQESIEEKSFARLSPEEAIELAGILRYAPNTGTALKHFLHHKHRNVVATDRNVLNLPAIGKSMTFKLVGFTPEGQRILRFEHDPTRQHSPIISRLGDIHIAESRSIASYLRQLIAMGENPEEYASLWRYTSHQTAPDFPVFHYPSLSFNTTSEITHLQL